MSGPPKWLRPYLQIPFVEHGRDWEGCDCWGWVRLILLHECGWDVPTLNLGYASTSDRDDIAAMTAGEAPNWQEVPVAEARTFDVVSLAIGGKACHVGLYVGAGWMAHLERGMTHVTVDRLLSLRWRDRIAGVYRWIAQP